MRKIPMLLILFLLSGQYCLAQFGEEIDKFKKVGWKLSSTDFNLSVKFLSIKKGPHKIEISRKAANPVEQSLLKTAEALFPEETTAENSETNNQPDYEREVFSPTMEEKPFWSTGSFDGVKIAEVISPRTIAYYQDVTNAYLKKQKPPSGGMLETSLSYSADIQYFERYEIAGEKFAQVHVVVMKLSWSQLCGRLCAMGFSRQKIVVFDEKNEPAAMFVNLYDGMWVS